MKINLIITIVTTFIFFTSFTAVAQVRTEGVLDLSQVAREISNNLQDYKEQSNELVEEIKATQKEIEKLKKDYKYSNNKNDKLLLQGNTYNETSRLINNYEQLFSLNMNTVEDILPKLDKMKKSAKKGALGIMARQLQNPEFKNNMNTLYSNLSTMALMLNNPGLKKEIAMLLKENELLYQKSKGVGAFDDIITNIDQVTKYLFSVYAKSKQKLRAIHQKKVKMELAIELMKYALALQPIHATMMQINTDEVFDIPEMNIDEIITSVVNENGNGINTDFIPFNEPDIDISLKSFQDGAKLSK